MFDKKAKPGQARQRQLDRYSQLVDRLSPKSAMGQGLFRAFLTGGIICCLGQGFIELGQRYLDMTVLHHLCQHDDRVPDRHPDRRGRV